jgi:hypothetical protein
MHTGAFDDPMMGWDVFNDTEIKEYIGDRPVEQPVRFRGARFRNRADPRDSYRGETAGSCRALGSWPSTTMVRASPTTTSAR